MDDQVTAETEDASKVFKWVKVGDITPFVNKEIKDWDKEVQEYDINKN